MRSGWPPGRSASSALVVALEGAHFAAPLAIAGAVGCALLVLQIRRGRSAGP